MALIGRLPFQNFSVNSLVKVKAKPTTGAVHKGAGEGKCLIDRLMQQTCIRGQLKYINSIYTVLTNLVCISTYLMDVPSMHLISACQAWSAGVPFFLSETVRSRSVTQNWCSETNSHQLPGPVQHPSGLGEWNRGVHLPPHPLALSLACLTVFGCTLHFPKEET